MREFSHQSPREQASVRVPLLMAIVFVMGVGVGVVGDRSLRKQAEPIPGAGQQSAGGNVENIPEMIEKRTTIAPALSALPTSELDEKNAADKIKRMLPNLDSLSLPDARQILREHALAEFKAANNETEARVREAQERLEQAQKGGSETEQQAAMKQLQELQTAQAERLKNIAIDLREQTAAIERMKSGPPK